MGPSSSSLRPNAFRGLLDSSLNLQSKSTYLIIHPSIVDLLVGAVSGPLSIALMGNLCNLWNNDRMIAS
ncbi:unnamed protein product, partial [Pocillopora meandrina]